MFLCFSHRRRANPASNCCVDESFRQRELFLELAYCSLISPNLVFSPCDKLSWGAHFPWRTEAALCRRCKPHQISFSADTLTSRFSFRLLKTNHLLISRSVQSRSDLVFFQGANLNVSMRLCTVKSCQHFKQALSIYMNSRGFFIIKSR